MSIGYQITKHALHSKSDLIQEILSNLCDKNGIINKITEKLSNSISENSEKNTNIQTNIAPHIEQLKNRMLNNIAKIKKLEIDYKKQTNTQTLKIKELKKYEYFIETSEQESQKLLCIDKFIKSGLNENNIPIFHTHELYIIEKQIKIIIESINAIENKIFIEICNEIQNSSEDLYAFSNSITQLDIITSLAIQAKKFNYCKPEITTNNQILITNGRHAILEKKMQNFISNDTAINNSSILITAPNMSGKSTFLKQNAIIVIMAQIGSYVPAEKATIGVVDKIFTRIGSYDQISNGMSTFMVEMTQISEILNNATQKSLIIIDEIGRGTGISDGFTISIAIIEYLCEEIKSRNIFVTHVCEIINSTKHINQLEYYTFRMLTVKDKEIKFTYQISRGFSTESNGIKIAEIAKIPYAIIEQAKKIHLQAKININYNN